MKDHEYQLMRNVEDTHWWYAVLHETVAQELAQQLDGAHACRILDAGCGTGGLLEKLRRTQPQWQITGLDISPTALTLARERGFEDLVGGSVDDLPFADGEFDAVVSLDVLYFAGVDDHAALAEFHRVLKPGGVLVLNLPAFEALRGSHDQAVSGVRRYWPGQVPVMVEQATLQHEWTHCWNLWLCPPLLVWRQLSRRLWSSAPHSDLFALPVWLNGLLRGLCRVDMIFCRWMRSSIGSSILTVARRHLSTPVLPA